MFLDTDNLYFPEPGAKWEAVNPRTVGWDPKKLEALIQFAGEQNSSSFLLLYRGKILVEKNWEVSPEMGGANDSLQKMYRYFQRGVNADNCPIEDVASVQKGLAAILAYMAREKGLLDFDDPVGKHLGVGWSLADEAAEGKITLRHILTMTTGLNEQLEFETEPGKKWFYNTPAYQHVIRVVAAAAAMDYRTLTREWLTGPIGMNDTTWIERTGFPKMNKVTMLGLASTARDLGRLGLLVLAGGRWGMANIINDCPIFLQMVKPSQHLNPAYGHLWYVNGQRHYILPQQTSKTDGPLWPAAPDDTVAALGLFSRCLFVCPALGLVMTRLGYVPGMALQGGPGFARKLWERLIAAAPKH
ncbi:MAG: beta-lactamase family protein [Deltaproteobacteria bacterium]|nr:beta-lactamase family protein [Deltaproteobacteria bacterium]